jgi:hypothetical protein
MLPFIYGNVSAHMAGNCFMLHIMHIAAFNRATVWNRDTVYNQHFRKIENIRPLVPKFFHNSEKGGVRNGEIMKLLPHNTMLPL